MSASQPLPFPLSAITSSSLISLSHTIELRSIVIPRSKELGQFKSSVAFNLSVRLKVNKIAARWPAKAVVQRFTSLKSSRHLPT